MIQHDGQRLIVLLIIAILIWHTGRAVFPEGAPPAFVVGKSRPVEVWLGEGFETPGIRQLNDDARLEDVMQLTACRGKLLPGNGLDPQVPVLSGQTYRVEQTGDRCELLSGGLISAAQRMALGIALHPDRMERDDWEQLKGIGPVLADRIERDRQRNGDFGALERLQRVKGIGPKRIEAWKPFF